MWCVLQEWLAREDGGSEEAGRHAAAASPCLFTRTPSLEQAGGLQRMTLRGHTGGISKVLLTPGGIDVITGAAPRAHWSDRRLAPAFTACIEREGRKWASPSFLITSSNMVCSDSCTPADSNCHSQGPALC